VIKSDVAKLNKRSITPLILVLLGLAVLSNRVFALRQFTGTLNPIISLDLPADSTSPGEADSRTSLLPVADEGISEPAQLPRDAVGIKADAQAALRQSRISANIQAGVPSKPPTYILQSVLNL
jgi:hypothetical protein